MPRTRTVRVATGSSGPGYVLNPKVRVTRRADGDGGVQDVFFKHAETGRLYRFGREEFHLLSELDAGYSFAEVAERFQAVFGKAVRPQVVEAFAEQMLKTQVLIRAETLREIEPAAVPLAADVANANDVPKDVVLTGEIVDYAPSGLEGAGEDIDEAEEPDKDLLDEIDDILFTADDIPARPAAGGPAQAAPGGFGRAAAAAGRHAAPGAAGASASPRPGPGPEPQSGGANGLPPDGREPDGWRSDGQSPDGWSPDGGGPENPAVAARRVRFRDRKPRKEKPPGTRGMVRLFDPTAMLRALSWLFGWWRPVRWLIYPLTLFAVLTVLQRLTEFSRDMLLSRGSFSLLGLVLVSLLTVNLVTRLAVGMAVLRHGGAVRSFGLRFVLFLIPRFAIDESGVMRLEREGKLAVYAATLRARLLLFVAATVIWAVTRQSPTMVSEIALVVEQIAIVTFLFSAFPLLSGDGYKWLATYFNQPMLRQRSYAYLFGVKAKGKMKFPEPTPGEKWAFGLYAIGSLLFMGLLLILLVVVVSTSLEGRFGGTGVALFFGITALLLVWLMAAKKSQQASRKEMMQAMMTEKMAGARAAGGMAGGAGGMAGLMQGGMARPQPGRTGTARPLPGVYAGNNDAARRRRWLARLGMAAALGGLIYVALLPYDYEAGGDFAILPNMRTQVIARVPGELAEVTVAEGDIVEQGQTMALLSDAQMTYQVATTRTQLVKAQAQLQLLIDGATAEEIALAREQVARAEAELPYLKAQADRALTLLERNAIPDVEADRYQSLYVSGQFDLRAAQANLAKVTAPPTASEITIREAEIEQLEADLAYRTQLLDQTDIRAPVAGRVVTENVAFMRGQYLDVGDLFVEIEDHTVAQAEVRVSETDIGLIEVGDRVRLKAWANAEAEIEGTVIAIAPLADTEDFGRTIRVKTEFPNSEGFFRPGMTGFAKISGNRMQTWEAFTRMFDRFFRIEVWGWIP